MASRKSTRKPIVYDTDNGLDNMDGRGWWICGPAEYTLPILPTHAPKEMGYVYGLKLTTNLVKIGLSHKPQRRIAVFQSAIQTYGNTDITHIALSHPTRHFKLLEAKLHKHFSDSHSRGELFDCSLAAVACAISNRAMVLPHNYVYSIGRPPAPWYWEARDKWYVNLKGKRVCLGPNKADAEMKFNSIMGLKK